MKDKQELNEEKLRNVVGGTRFDFQKAKELAKLVNPDYKKREEEKEEGK